MRNRWIILVLAAAVINLPCAHASFITTSATATVIDPPAGTSYYAGSYLTSHTSHTITVKKVDNNPQ